MSFDIVAFDRKKAPSSKKGFIRWYRQQTEWKEDEYYDDISVATPKLRVWYEEMIKRYPPMNGRDSVSFEQLTEEYGLPEENVTDYSISPHLIYASFSYSASEFAWEEACRLANEYGLGLYATSNDTIYKYSPKHYLTRKEALVASLVMSLKILTISVVGGILLVIGLDYLLGSSLFLGVSINVMCTVALLTIISGTMSYYWQHYGLYKAAERELDFHSQLIQKLELTDKIYYITQGLNLPFVNTYFLSDMGLNFQSQIADYQLYKQRKDTFSIILSSAFDLHQTELTLSKLKDKCEQLCQKDISIVLTVEKLEQRRCSVLKITIPKKKVTVSLVKAYLGCLNNLQERKEPRNVFIKKYDDEEEVTYYIHFHGGYAVRQIEVSSDGLCNSYSLDMHPVAMTDMLWEELESQIQSDEYMSKEEFDVFWSKCRKVVN